MIVENTDPAENQSDGSDAESDQPEEVSKSQHKRDALEIRRLTEIIGGMSAEQRDMIPMPDTIRSAFAELDRTGSRGARKRQVGFVTKLLRVNDLTEIRTAVEGEQLRARAHTLAHHRVEEWRDRLLGLSLPETPKEALTSLLAELPEIDRQQTAQLQRNALKELNLKPDAPSKSARQLFRLIRDAIADSEPY